MTLKAARRLALLDFARAEKIAIVEDDCEHDFHYDGRPHPFARFNFASLNERELPEAVKRMAAARLPRAAGSGVTLSR